MLLIYGVIGIISAIALTYLFKWLIEPIVASSKNKNALEYQHKMVDPSTGKSVPWPARITQEPTMDISVIVPAYNEEERLPAMLDEAIHYFADRGHTSYEIIVVDDGSRDRTTAVALRYADKHSTQRIRVLTLEANQGKGGAVQQGMLHARGRYLLMADADGATRFSDLDQLRQRMANTEKDGQGIVVGSRAHLEDAAVAKRKWYRNVLMYGFHFAVSTLCVKGVRDTQCGFKLFTRNTARNLFQTQNLRRWCFDVELLHVAQRLNIPISEVAVNWEEIPGSKLRLIEATLMMARDLLVIRFCYMTGIWQVKTGVFV